MSIESPTVATILDLARLKIVSLDQVKTLGVYVAGEKIGDLFIPIGDLQGEISIEKGNQQGTPGWVEIGTQQFVPMYTARSPVKPYIEGFMLDNRFIPSSKNIVR